MYYKLVLERPNGKTLVLVERVTRRASKNVVELLNYKLNLNPANPKLYVRDITTGKYELFTRKWCAIATEDEYDYTPVELW